ncbi:MAG: hypothetical protein JWR32_2045 [Mycobacterium sp.]|nr:hypothetical protein [Mycobacterium sp.]
MRPNSFPAPATTTRPTGHAEREESGVLALCRLRLAGADHGVVGRRSGASDHTTGPHAPVVPGLRRFPKSGQPHATIINLGYSKTITPPFVRQRAGSQAGIHLPRISTPDQRPPPRPDLPALIDALTQFPVAPLEKSTTSLVPYHQHVPQTAAVVRATKPA